MSLGVWGVGSFEQSELVRGDFQRYTNQKGFVSNRTLSSGNDLLYTCIAAVVRHKHGALSLEEKADLLFTIHKHCRRGPGIYVRPGWEQDQQRHDDYTGLCALASVGINSFAADVVEAGEDTVWYFDTNGGSGLDWRAWFWPFRAFVCHAYWAAGMTPSWLNRLCWSFSVAWSGSKKKQDEWILSWLLIQVAGNRGRLERWATRKYWARLYKAYPNGLSDVFKNYFGGDAEHPLAKWWLP